jgi:hypothetical protein
MSAAMRPYATAGVALAGASLIAITPIALGKQSPATGVTSADVHLASSDSVDVSDLLNVPVNLIHDVANIPYDLFSAPYSVQGLIPNFTDGDEHTPPESDWYNYGGPFDSVSDHGDTFHGALNFLAGSLDYTDSWYESDPTQVWGWDTGNTWNAPALLNVLFPFQRAGDTIDDNPVSDNINKLFEAESPPASSDDTLLFHDPIGELTDQFNVDMSKLTSGDGYYLDPDDNVNNVGHGADPLGDGGDTYHEIWSGTNDKVSSSYGFDDVLANLTQDPSDNPIQAPNLEDIYPSLVHMYHAANVDFSPFDPGTDSLLSYGADKLFGIPAIANGLFNGEHGLDPGSPDVLPTSLTQPIEDAVNNIIGPDSGLGQGIADIAGRIQDLSEGSLETLLPDSDPLHESFSNVISDATSTGYVNAPRTGIEDVLNNNSGPSFDDDDFSAYEPNEGDSVGDPDTFDVATALQSNMDTDILGGDVSASEVTSALHEAGISISDDSDLSAGDIADALNDASSEAGGSGGDATSTAGGEGGGLIGDLAGGLL